MGSTFRKLCLWVLLLAGAVYFAKAWYDKLPPRDAASMMMGIGEYQRAIPLLEAAFEQSNKDMDIVLDIAECYDRTGDTKTTRRMYAIAQEFLDSKPSNGKYAYHHERAHFLRIMANK